MTALKLLPYIALMAACSVFTAWVIQSLFALALVNPLDLPATHILVAWCAILSFEQAAQVRDNF